MRIPIKTAGLNVIMNKDRVIIAEQGDFAVLKNLNGRTQATDAMVQSGEKQGMNAFYQVN